MALVAGTGTGGGASASSTPAKPVINIKGVSPYFFPAAIGLILLLMATWKTKARGFVIGFSVLILTGIVLQWWPAFDAQFKQLAVNLNLPKG